MEIPGIKLKKSVFDHEPLFDQLAVHKFTQLLLKSPISDLDFTGILDPGLSEGVLFNLPCLFSVHGPSLNISETAHYFFLKFCMKLGINKVKKVTGPRF